MEDLSTFCSESGVLMDAIRRALQNWVNLVRRLLGWRSPVRRSMNGDRRLRRCLHRLRNELWDPADENASLEGSFEEGRSSSSFEFSMTFPCVRSDMPVMFSFAQFPDEPNGRDPDDGEGLLKLACVSCSHCLNPYHIALDCPNVDDGGPHDNGDANPQAP